VSDAKLKTKKSSSTFLDSSLSTAKFPASWRGKVRKTAVLRKIKPLFEKKKTEKERSTSIIYKNGKSFLLDVLGRAVPPSPLGVAVANLMAVAVVAPAPSVAVAAQRARGRVRGLGVITVGRGGDGLVGEGRLGCVGRGSPLTLARWSRTGSRSVPPEPGTRRGSAWGRRTSSTATRDTEVGVLVLEEGF
jgi:hypothetical protein